MSPRTVDWDRLSGASGLAFVGAAGLGSLLVRDEPGPRASSGDVSAWLGGERSEILTAAIVWGVALVFLLWFAAALALALRAAGEPRLALVAFGGAAVFAASLTGAVALVAGSAFAGDVLEPEVAGGLFAVHWGVHVLASFPLAVLIGATSIAAGRTRLFGGWYYWGSEGVAVAVLLGGTLWARDGVWSPDGAYATFAALVAVAWVLVTSVLLVLVRR